MSNVVCIRSRNPKVYEMSVHTFGSDLGQEELNLIFKHFTTQLKGKRVELMEIDILGAPGNYEVSLFFKQ